MSSGLLPWPQTGPGREGDTAGCFLSILHLFAPLFVIPTPNLGPSPGALSPGSFWIHQWNQSEVGNLSPQM